VVEVKDWLLSEKRAVKMPQTKSYLDTGFINETAWSLKRILAPKHAIHI